MQPTPKQWLAIWLGQSPRTEQTTTGRYVSTSQHHGGGVFITKAYSRNFTSTHWSLTWNNAAQHLDTERQHQRVANRLHQPYGAFTTVIWKSSGDEKIKIATVPAWEKETSIKDRLCVFFLVKGIRDNVLVNHTQAIRASNRVLFISYSVGHLKTIFTWSDWLYVLRKP